MTTTPAGVQPCSGRCCRNPFGVCYHSRECAHHLPADVRQRILDLEATAAEAQTAADRRAARARSVLTEGRR